MEYLQYLAIGKDKDKLVKVLNLVISGIPSIQDVMLVKRILNEVLNLVISGIPSILSIKAPIPEVSMGVLNLVISGIPSILYILLLLV